MRAWVLLLLPLLAMLVAAGASPPEVSPEESARILARFDHASHDRALKREKLGCTACHQVGARGEARLDPEAVEIAVMSVPAGSCHYCHVPSSGRRGRGPRTCSTCHDGGMAPESHGAGFRNHHGPEARSQRKACHDCHKRAECVDCHDRKDSSRFRVHDRAWLSVHGIAVRAQPASCSSCHLKASCVRCHSTGNGRTP